MKTANKRLYDQYDQAPKFLKWIGYTTEIIDEEFRKAFKKITFNIDKAEGPLLTHLAHVVGIDRGYAPSSDEFFGYTGTNMAKGYEQAPYYRLGEVDTLVPLSDDVMRTAIKATIIRNNSTGTIDDIFRVVKLVTGYDSTVIIPQPMTLGIKILGTTSISDDASLVFSRFDVLPIPHGVEYTGISF